MTSTTTTLMDDLGHAHETAPTYLWGTIVSGIVSLFLPIVGLVAAYSGYRLTEVMSKTWFGLCFAALGLASVTMWILGLVLWQLGYVSL